VLEARGVKGKRKFGKHEDQHTLGDMGIDTGVEIHCVDENPMSVLRNGGFQDLSAVDKYEMPDQVYDTLPNSVRAIQREKYETDPEYRASVDARRDRALLAPVKFQAEAEALTVGERCNTKLGRGVIRYVGKTKGDPVKPGYWVGVQLDEPNGTNNGHVGDAVYFECDNKFGVLLRPPQVEMGDFPEIDEFASDLEDSISEL
ncbi:hypothetical protein KIPB_008866, partial [Kipferlia bialata]